MNKKQILQDLSEFIAIQSVSADPSKCKEMSEAVHFLKKKLIKIGFKVEILKKGRSPSAIFAKYIVSGAKKTIGIYGHYDVQPEDPQDEWTVTPFKLTRKNGKLLGRGVADNKGHVIQNLTAIQELIQSQSLKSNIVFFVEGEEECGSESFLSYMKKKQKDLGSLDVFFITDVGMHAKFVPQIIYALRGLAYFELSIQIGKRDLHSGVYGNAVLNPAQVLAELLVKMKDITTGEVHIPGFYDDVRPINSAEMKLLKRGSVKDATFKKETETFAVTTMRNVPSYLAPKIFPSLDVHGIESGFTGEGPKTVIPRTARVKFSCRLVEYQNVKDIEKKVHRFIQKTLPKGVQYALHTFSYDDPFYTSVQNPYIKKTAELLTEHFKNKTVLMREGGSVPAAEMMQRLFKTPVILTGFVLPDSNLHAPDENFDEEMFFEGIEALKKIYRNI